MMHVFFMSPCVPPFIHLSCTHKTPIKYLSEIQISLCILGAFAYSNVNENINSACTVCGLHTGPNLGNCAEVSDKLGNIIFILKMLSGR